MPHNVARNITLLGAAISLYLSAGNAQKAALNTDRSTAPEYSIAFDEGDAVAGIGRIPAIRLPFECSEDGTVFIHIVQSSIWGKPPSNLALNSLSMLLTSISSQNEARSFPLDTIPSLHDIRQSDDYVSGSEVVFLMNATAAEEQPNAPSDEDHDLVNTAPHHLYIVLFDRDGTYKKTIQVDDSFEVTHIGLFPSGIYLAYGYDRTDKSPRLALLKEDGMLLKYLEVPKGDLPGSAMGNLNGTGSGPAVYIAPVQFLGQSHSIYVLQNNTNLPILEISEAGAVRVLKLRLPEGQRISMLIPSGSNLYGRMADTRDGSIYEFSSEDGSVLKHFMIPNDQSGADIACVHDNAFLSFKQAKGRLVPLHGEATLSSKQK